MKRNPNRGVVLKMHHAAALARWMELTLYDKKFNNPIEAAETKTAAMEATGEILEKLKAIYLAHRQ